MSGSQSEDAHEDVMIHVYSDSEPTRPLEPVLLDVSSEIDSVRDEEQLSCMRRRMGIKMPIHTKEYYIDKCAQLAEKNDVLQKEIADLRRTLQETSRELNFTSRELNLMAHENKAAIKKCLREVVQTMEPVPSLLQKRNRTADEECDLWKKRAAVLKLQVAVFEQSL